MKTSGPSMTQVLSVPCPSIFCQGLQVLLLITHPVIVPGGARGAPLQEGPKSSVKASPTHTQSSLELCCCLIAKSCLILCDPMDSSLPSYSVHGILQARVLEWVAIPFSRGSFQSRVGKLVCVSCIGSQILYH